MGRTVKRSNRPDPSRRGQTRGRVWTRAPNRHPRPGATGRLRERDRDVGRGARSAFGTVERSRRRTRGRCATGGGSRYLDRAPHRRRREATASGRGVGPRCAECSGDAQDRGFTHLEGLGREGERPRVAQVEPGRQRVVAGEGVGIDDFHLRPESEERGWFTDQDPDAAGAQRCKNPGVFVRGNPSIAGRPRASHATRTGHGPCNVRGFGWSAIADASGKDPSAQRPLGRVCSRLRPPGTRVFAGYHT